MDFNVTDEQQMLADATRVLLTKFYPAIEDRNRVTGEELGWNRDAWGALADMGVLAMSLPEADGGMAAGAVEAMLVLTEVGRALAPEPLWDAVLGPSALIVAAGGDEQRAAMLPGLADGSLLCAVAHHEPGGRWPHVPVTTAASEGPDGWRVTGTKNPVLHGDCADVALVSAALPSGGTGLFLVPSDGAGVTRIGYATHDGLRGAQWELADAAAVPLGHPSDRGATLVEWEVRAQSALCAEAVGAMSEALRLTVEYLKNRRQFGVPLAKFQTLTHRAADMYVALELARSMSMYAAMSIDAGEFDPVVASRARLRVSRSARLIGQEAIQMHGGIGLTAEYPLAHYVSRLTAIEHTLGGGADHLRRISDGIGDHRMVTLGD
ncbi:acyl-CoA dehydrogenase family protein [Tsukamurella ocularis]|uniref:acyl-CoA dehydrogenase family protein n=1 Tax=Tsukamurella ocularis TaxID=1970234 RepID=UPI0039F0B8AB